MSPLAFTVSLIFFVGAFLAITALYWGTRDRDRAAALERRLRVGDGAGNPGAGVLRDMPEPPRSGTLRAPIAWLTLQLRNAGSASPPRTLALQMVLSGVAGLLVTGLLFTGPGQATGLLVAATPVLLLRSKARRRHTALVAQLPEALDLIARSLRAGHALPDALRTAAAEMQDPLGQELMTLSEQHRLGRPLRECFDRMVSNNAEIFDLRLLSSAVMLQRETGANLIEILEHLSKTIRERQVFTHKLAALTAEVRVSAAILAAMPFVVALTLLVLRPEYLKPLVTAPLGQGLLWTGVVLMGTGLMLMRALARVEA